MQKTQKILTITLWGLMVLVMVSVISAGLFRPREAQNAPPPLAVERPAVYADAPAFTLVDQEGKTFTTESLKGKVWIADFIFTHCAGPCRGMTRRMSRLQEELPGEDVKFVSISVDPERDTPEKLKAYAGEFAFDAKRWSFLTGDKDEIYGTARGMLVSVMPGTENTPLEHSEKFVLVDAAGKIRMVEHSKNDQAMAGLIAKAKELAAEAKKGVVVKFESTAR